MLFKIAAFSSNLKTDHRGPTDAAQHKKRLNMQIDTLIESRWIIPIAPKGIVLENHAVSVADGKIAAILPIEEARQNFQAAETVMLPDSVLMPGMVNLHSHAAMNLVRGLGADLPLMDWLTTKIWPAEGKLMSPNFVREGAYLAGLEMAAGGVTTTSDHYFFPIDAAEGLRAAGLRCATSAFIIGFPSAWAKNDVQYLARMEKVLDNFKDDPFVKVTVAPHAPYTVNDASLKACAELSEKWNAPIHMHVHETAGEVSDSIKQHGMRPLERLKKLGLVNERLIAVHSVHLNDEDIAMLAEAHASTCHCPCSNLKLASGFSPVAKLMKAGVNVGIGTDGAASNDKLDMLGETRLAAMLAKAVANDTTCATVHDMLEAATLGGARALHWEDRIGSIESGKEADLFAVNLSSIDALPVQDPAAQLLYAAGREHVTHTWVAGKLIAKKQQTVTFPQAPRSLNPAAIAEKWRLML